MSFSDHIKLGFVSWGVPILIVLVAFFAIPSPDQKLNDFQSADLASPVITISEHSGRRGSDHFQLNITQGDLAFYHRDPEREPIVSLFNRIPKNLGLKVTYEPSLEGNVLLDVRSIERNASPYLDFATTMGEYSKRRLVIYTVAGIWFLLGSLLFYAMATVKVTPPPPQAQGPSQMGHQEN